MTSLSAPLVIDTNIVLDLLLFNDPKVTQLKYLLQTGAVRWLTTAAMRAELERVLDYALIVPQLAKAGVDKQQVLQQFDAFSQEVVVAEQAACLCRDADDQKFIDLAVAHRALLLSKDRAVLKLRRALIKYGVTVQTQLLPEPDKVGT